MLPRFKIQYPMKNQGETNRQKPKLQVPRKRKNRMWKSLTNEGFIHGFKRIILHKCKHNAGLLFYTIAQTLSMNKAYLEELATFIREHRSNEENFEKLAARLETVTTNGNLPGDYQNKLQTIKEKELAVYSQAKETGGTAWPEFEKFVSEFEKTIMEAVKEAA